MSEYTFRTKPTKDFYCEGCLWNNLKGDCHLHDPNLRDRHSVEEMLELFGCTRIREIVVLVHKVSDQEVDPEALVRQFST